MSDEIVKRESMEVGQIERMAKAMAGSGLFGVKNEMQAVALMLVAQAEGLHPATACRDYNVIQGRPALKSDAMLARFQASGGVVEWEEMTDERCAAHFSHPKGSPKPVLIDWDMARAKVAGLADKQNWHTYPRQMLRSRVISEGIRATWPACNSGVYTPEEVVDFVPALPEKPQIAMPTAIQPPKTIEVDVKTVEKPKVASTPAPAPDKPAKGKEGGKAVAVVVGEHAEHDQIETGIIEEVEIKEGKGKTGKPWTRYGITVNTTKFGCFDKTVGETAEALKGQNVELAWKTDGKYKTAVSILPVDVAGATANDAGGTDANDDDLPWGDSPADESREVGI